MLLKELFSVYMCISCEKREHMWRCIQFIRASISVSLPFLPYLPFIPISFGLKMCPIITSPSHIPHLIEWVDLISVFPEFHDIRSACLHSFRCILHTSIISKSRFLKHENTNKHYFMWTTPMRMQMEKKYTMHFCFSGQSWVRKARKKKYNTQMNINGLENGENVMQHCNIRRTTKHRHIEQQVRSWNKTKTNTKSTATID